MSDVAVHMVGDVDPNGPVTVLGECGDLGAAAQGGGRVPGQVGPQEGFQLRLVEHVGLGVAVAAVVGVAVQLGEHGHVRLEQPQPVAGPGDRGELVADPEAGQDAVDLVVEVDRAGLRVDRRPTGPGPGMGCRAGRAGWRRSARWGLRR